MHIFLKMIAAENCDTKHICDMVEIMCSSFITWLATYQFQGAPELTTVSLHLVNPRSI